jgi:hypothetical protein
MSGAKYEIGTDVDSSTMPDSSSGRTGKAGKANEIFCKFFSVGSNGTAGGVGMAGRGAIRGVAGGERDGRWVPSAKYDGADFSRAFRGNKKLGSGTVAVVGTAGSGEVEGIGPTGTRGVVADWAGGNTEGPVPDGEAKGRAEAEARPPREAGRGPLGGRGAVPPTSASSSSMKSSKVGGRTLRETGAEATRRLEALTRDKATLAGREGVDGSER